MKLRMGRLAVALLGCAFAIGAAGCGSEEEEPPGTTPGDVEPVGELAGPTSPLNRGAFDNILALTVEAAGEGQTLIAGQVEVTRGGAPAEVRIVVDGKEERSAEATQSTDGRSIVIACACDLGPGEHDVELQGRAILDPVPVAARSLVALDGVEYATPPQGGSGPLPPALSGAALETSPVLVSGAPTSLANLTTSGTASGDQTLIIAEIGSTRASVNLAGVALQAGVNGEEADRLADLTSASIKINAFGLGVPASGGATVDLIGNVVGGGSAEADLVSVVVCPCGLETES